jgi:hypothetical protein
LQNLKVSHNQKRTHCGCLPNRNRQPSSGLTRALAAYRTAELDYLNEQRNKPQTVALALTDSPIGTAAWIVEKLKIWSDSPDPLEPVFTKDQVLTNVMIYLVPIALAPLCGFIAG